MRAERLTAGRAAAEILPMATADRETEWFRAGENRHHEGRIRYVCAAGKRIVENHDIARVEVLYAISVD